MAAPFTVVDCNPATARATVVAAGPVPLAGLREAVAEALPPTAGAVLLLLLLHLETRAASPVRLQLERNVALDDNEDPPPPPPPPPRYVQPVCQVTFGRAMCMRGGSEVDCPAKVDQVRHDTKVTSSGAWELSPTYTYFLDRGIVIVLTRLFAGSSVVELGAGKGCYDDALRRARSPRADIPRI
jgi:hypothetical protein